MAGGEVGMATDVVGGVDEGAQTLGRRGPLRRLRRRSRQLLPGRRARHWQVAAAGGLVTAACAGVWLAGGSNASVPPARRAAATRAARADATSRLAAVLTATGGTGRARQAGPPPSGAATITVTGTGTAQGQPDTLVVQMGVSTHSASAVTALDTNSTDMAALEQVFAAAGVPSSELQTNQLSIQPDYTNAGAIRGYEVDDALTVTLRDLAHAGTVIDDAAHAVGNAVRIDGVSFSLSQPSALLGRARAAAFADAQRAASALAAAAGSTLGGIQSITDLTNQQQQPPDVFASGRVAAPASTPVPLQAGTTEVSAEVRVVWALGS